MSPQTVLPLGQHWPRPPRRSGQHTSPYAAQHVASWPQGEVPAGMQVGELPRVSHLRTRAEPVLHQLADSLLLLERTPGRLARGNALPAPHQPSILSPNARTCGPPRSTSCRTPRCPWRSRRTRCVRGRRWASVQARSTGRGLGSPLGSTSRQRGRSKLWSRTAGPCRSSRCLLACTGLVGRAACLGRKGAPRFS